MRIAVHMDGLGSVLANERCQFERGTGQVIALSNQVVQTEAMLSEGCTDDSSKLCRLVARGIDEPDKYSTRNETLV